MSSLRNDFPFFDEHPELTYLDSAATTQKPAVVLEAVTKALTSTTTVHRSTFPLAEQQTESYEAVRKQVAGFIHATPEEVIFTPSATYAANLLAQGLAHTLTAESEILVGEAEHHSNLLPWRAVAEQTGAKLTLIPSNDGSYTAESIVSLLNERVGYVVLSHASNVTGALTDIPALRALLPNHAKLILDCSQTAAHLPLEAAKLADALFFAAHKVYAPSGTGVLYVNPTLQKDLRPTYLGGGMVQRVWADTQELQKGVAQFEAGSPNLESVLGLGAALSYLEAIPEKTNVMGERLITMLSALPFVSILGTPHPQIGLVGFSVTGAHPHDIAHILGEQGVCIRAGQHCSGPLHDTLGVPASLRASCGVYTNEEDIINLEGALKTAYAKLNS